MTANRRIIGLLGPRGAGKDLAASYIRGILPGTLSLAFADPIRAMLSELLECPERPMKEQEWKSSYLPVLHCTGRQALDRFGEGMKMLFNQEIWVTHWQRRVGSSAGFNVVVPDVRSELEIEAILAAGGELWHVCRTGVSYTYTGEKYDVQPSVRLEDSYLLNYGSKLRFKDNVRSLVKGSTYQLANHGPAEVSGVGPIAPHFPDCDEGYETDKQNIKDMHAAMKPEEDFPKEALKSLDEVLKGLTSNCKDDNYHPGPQFLEGSGHD